MPPPPAGQAVTSRSRRPGGLGTSLTSPPFPSSLSLFFNRTTESKQKEKCQMTFVACVPIVSDASFQGNIGSFSPRS